MSRAAVLAFVTSCSFALTSNPPPPCTEKAIAPIADTAIAVIATLGVVYFATSDDDNAELGMVVEGALAAGFAAGAYVGYRRVGRCRDAKALSAPR